MEQETDDTTGTPALIDDSEEPKEGVVTLKGPETEKTQKVSPSPLQKGKDILERATSLGKRNQSENEGSTKSNEQLGEDSDNGMPPSKQDCSTSEETGGATTPVFSSPLRKGKELLGRAKSRGKKNPSDEGESNRADPQAETESDEDKHPPRKSNNVLSQVKKATEATKQKVKRMVPKRSSEKSGASQDSDYTSATESNRKIVTFEQEEVSDSFTVETSNNDDNVSEEDLSRRVSELSIASSLSPRGVMIHIGPISSFFLRDSSIIIGITLVIASLPTYLYWESIRQNQMPIGVSLSWMLVSFAVGRELERVHGSGEVLPSVITLEEQEIVADGKDLPRPERSVVMDHSEIGKDQLKESHSIFRKATENFKKVRFRLSEQKKPTAKKPRKMFWTNLNRSRHGANKQRWEKNAGSAATSAPLLRGLYRDPTLRLKNIEPLEKEGDVLVDQDLPSVEPDQSLGTFDLGSCTADTLADHVVQPLLKLRGMDVYLTGDDGAQDGMGNHPFLIENGIRSKKTWVVNVMIQWANVLIYFELPDWIEDFDSIIENDDDPDDVKALKRFLNGNDEYRNKRLKLLPALVDGTRLVKMLAPPKKELTVASVILPVNWNKCNGDGQDKQPMVEVELDCQASKAMRGMASIVKRNLSTTTIDLAVIIQKPDGSNEDEPSACLGMWRFDCVDIETCPRLPERVVSEQEVVRRASLALMGISPEEMAEIDADAGPE